jgi:hypothetical protein
MASNKNQHFVPRCYLKPFTLAREGAAINLYNVDRRKGVRNASAKDQCAKTYFYGEDLRVEKLLQKPEGAYAELLRNIAFPSYIMNNSDAEFLRRFCYLQYCRTDAASIRFAASLSDMVDIAFDGNPSDEWKVNMRDVIDSGISNFQKTMHIVDDLKVCLIHNKTNIPFIISDDPAILTNKWHLQKSKARGMSFGVGSSGALFFFPLTPEIMCILYDGGVYNVSNVGGWTSTNKISDIAAFNEHQLLCCLANIYFPEWSNLTIIDENFEKVQSLRPIARHEAVTAVLSQESEDYKRYIVVPREEMHKQKKEFVNSH